ncbi:MAG: hypothetical protein CMH62_03380 [Nanoarchaeota archaeon]|nr:hypothetical protein [Nanoarchaeota archaeon]|tara:strand:- start:322 stop:1281 length:960 start_codon:yes stop_codon:yes gene_type:complete
MLKYKILFVLFALVFLVGCSNFGGSSFLKKDNVEVDEIDPFKGNKGLELSFFEGSPPDDVFQDTNFAVTVEAHNQGALNIERGTARLGALSGRFTISGANTREFGIIRGKQNFPDIGDREVIEWDNINAKRTSVRSDTRQSVNVQVCYEGNIEANPEACVRPRPGSDGIIEGECDVGKESFSGGHGGPIAVTSITDTIVKQSDSTNIIRYAIEFKDVGGGDIINMDEIDNCLLSERDKRDADVVFDIGWFGESRSFKCKFAERKDGQLVMRNGKGRILCDSPDVSNLDHYSVPLYIKMNYGYVKSINTGFTLKKDVFFD